jgi:hypothetical protein
MTKFIRMKTTAGNQILTHTRYIQSVIGDAEGNNCTVYVAGGVETDDWYKVTHTVDEIQAMIEGDTQAIQQQPKFDHGPFNL